MSTVEQVVVLAGFAVTVIGLVWALSSRAEWKMQATDANRRLKLVRTDRDNWKEAAARRLATNNALSSQLAHVVVAANTTPAPTSPTDNETSVA